MKTLDQIIKATLGVEGGYSNHPSDPGGATNWGITERVARANGYTGDMRQLPRAEAIRIYKALYWTAPKLSAVSAIFPVLAIEMFDTGVNMGPAAAVKFLQRALNALNRGAKDYPDQAIDGLVGPAVLNALSRFKAKRGAAGESVIVKAVEALQGERYIALAEKKATNEDFVYGWLANRVGLGA